jgi:hypothetical protein
LEHDELNKKKIKNASSFSRTERERERERCHYKGKLKLTNLLQGFHTYRSVSENRREKLRLYLFLGAVIPEGNVSNWI